MDWSFLGPIVLIVCVDKGVDKNILRFNIHEQEVIPKAEVTGSKGPGINNSLSVDN
jgi:hypothetical protein